MDFLSQTITLHELAAWISAVLIFVSSFRYMQSIIIGKTKPNVVGWLLYQMATICVLISAYELDAMSTIVASLAYAINQLIILIMAFYYGYARMNRVEGIYFGISLFSLILWAMFSHSNDILPFVISATTISLLVLLINTFIDLMGATSIFTKLYREPETEDSMAWFLAFLSGFFSLIAVESYSLEELVYPLYLFFSNLAIWLLCFRKKPRWRFRHIMHIIEKVTGSNWRGRS